ncbi:MAG TPA: hypothetical protein DCW47_08115 [Lachnospiraceae bacterium]|nr:hypothetical protein [Lachnospiraceae bacterium]
MDTKKIPLTVMLLGAFVTSVVTYINNYTLSEMLVALLISLVVFLILGLIVSGILNKFVPLPEEEETDGEVIEKDAEALEEEPEDDDTGMFEKTGAGDQAY